MSFKSFLDWLNSGKGVGAAASQKDELVNWREKRRDNRVDLDVDRQLVVHLLNPEEGDKGSTLIARVRNVSMRGCGLIFQSAEDRNKVKTDQNFVASLAVDDFPIPLNVKVVRISGALEAGLQFKPPYPRELEKLERFLEPRCLGRSLREIDPGSIQKETKKGFRWFQGVNETNLFSWADPDAGTIIQQQLVFLDKVVEWRRDSSLQTGRVRQDSASAESGISWVKSELLEFDPVAEKAVLNQAAALLESSQINDIVKNTFLEKIRSR